MLSRAECLRQQACDNAVSRKRQKGGKKKSASDGAPTREDTQGPEQNACCATNASSLLTYLAANAETNACLRACAARFLCARARRPLHNLWMAFCAKARRSVRSEGRGATEALTETRQEGSDKRRSGGAPRPQILVCLPLCARTPPC